MLLGLQAQVVQERCDDIREPIGKLGMPARNLGDERVARQRAAVADAAQQRDCRPEPRLVFSHRVALVLGGFGPDPPQFGTNVRLLRLERTRRTAKGKSNRFVRAF